MGILDTIMGKSSQPSVQPNPTEAAPTATPEEAAKLLSQFNDMQVQAALPTEDTTSTEAPQSMFDLQPDSLSKAAAIAGY